MFSYPVFYLALPLSTVQKIDSGGVWFGVNRKAITSFWEKDYLAEPLLDSSVQTLPLIDKVRTMFAQADIDLPDGEIVLMTMPRILGYAFNPVSFFFCYDAQSRLRSVISQVNNTFGESHCYLCHREDSEAITGADWITAEKQFHVSPFFAREGSYQFRFHETESRLTIQIDHVGEDGGSELLTSVSGSLVALSQRSIRRSFWRYPMQTLLVTFRIHWHALRLWRKGIAYIRKPEQKTEKVTRSAKCGNSHAQQIQASST